MYKCFNSFFFFLGVVVLVVVVVVVVVVGCWLLVVGCWLLVVAAAYYRHSIGHRSSLHVLVQCWQSTQLAMARHLMCYPCSSHLYLSPSCLSYALRALPCLPPPVRPTASATESLSERACVAHHPELKPNTPAQVFCMSWRADFEFRVT